MSSKKANRRIFRNAFAQDWKEVEKSRAMMNIFLFVAFSVKEGNFPRRKMVEGEKMMEGGWCREKAIFRMAEWEFEHYVLCVVRKIIFMMLVGDLKCFCDEKLIIIFKIRLLRAKNEFLLKFYIKFGIFYSKILVLSSKLVNFNLKTSFLIF